MSAGPTVSETGETPRCRTYREIGRLVGRSPATVWRLLNRGRRLTHTQAARELRAAMVLSLLRARPQIRRIALDLAISQSAVERDLRLLRRRR